MTFPLIVTCVCCGFNYFARIVEGGKSAIFLIYWKYEIIYKNVCTKSIEIWAPVTSQIPTQSLISDKGLKCY